MNGFYSVVLGLLVQFVIGWQADVDKKHIVEPQYSLFLQWNSSSPMREFKIADQMVYEFEVINASLPFALNLRVFNMDDCDWIRICLPYDGTQEPKLGKRYDLCVGQQTVDFHYKKGKLTLPESTPMQLQANFSNDDVITFHSDGKVDLRHGRTSDALSEGKLTKLFFAELVEGRRFNFTFLQKRAKCRAKLRENEGESAVELTNVYSVFRFSKHERKGYNLWAIVIAMVGGSLLGGLAILTCEIKCRYTIYSGYYEALYIAYGYNPSDTNLPEVGITKSKESVGGSNDKIAEMSKSNEKLVDSSKQIGSKALKVNDKSTVRRTNSLGLNNTASSKNKS